MRIDRLTFRAGEIEGGAPLKMGVGNITVFIGPNNGGKSAALREIFTRIADGHDIGSIFSEIKILPLGTGEIESKISELVQPNIPATQIANVMFGSRGNRQEVNLSNLRSRLENEVTYARYSPWAHQVFLKHFVLNLDGQSRLGLVNSAGGQSLREHPHTTLAALFKDNELRHTISEIVRQAFGQYLVVDATLMGQFQYALADTQPSVDIARSFGDEAIDFFDKCTRLESTSDGTKAFIGILTEVLAGNHDVLLMDEPEAFLHPSLAYLLGREIAQNITDKKQMFVSTHSPYFLMGCMSVGTEVDIVRLTYKAKVATARLLPAAQLERILFDPLLKSVGVMSALFFESAIVVEADSDRAFYEEINSRLNLHDKGGIRHTTFLNAHNKQEAAHIARVLRNIGIPSPIVLDLDWIKEDGKVAQRYLAAAGVPDGLRPGLLDTRRRVRSSLEATGNDYKTSGGVSKLTGAELATARAFFDQMDRYGLFTVRNGELEHWLRHLGVIARKDQWLTQMFERMGAKTANPEYVVPDKGDVWDFIRSIGAWALNGGREGMEFVDPAEL